uniref:Uncharacterized protein n=1 Tax=Glossina austeni TaxID=7395 RepID=A0A1A9VPC4_GLOAU
MDLDHGQRKVPLPALLGFRANRKRYEDIWAWTAVREVEVGYILLLCSNSSPLQGLAQTLSKTKRKIDEYEVLDYNTHVGIFCSVYIEVPMASVNNGGEKSN